MRCPTSRTVRSPMPARSPLPTASSATSFWVTSSGSTDAGSEGRGAMRRLLMAAVVAVVSTSGAVAAEVFDDPKGLIEYAYAPYVNGTDLIDFTELFSPTLK